MIALFFDLFDSLLNLLPGSPFQSIFDSLSGSQFIRFMNWILPIDRMLSILQLWISALMTFYAFKLGRKYVYKVLDIFIH